MKECFIQVRFAKILLKDRRYNFSNLLSALHYVRANWQALKEQVSVGMLWKPNPVRRMKFHKVIVRRS